jgi:transcriptional regulator with XRE-family HTH domain
VIRNAGQQAFCVAVHKMGPAVVSRRVGVTKKTVHNWVNGERHPNSGTRAKISKALGIETSLWDDEVATPDTSVPVTRDREMAAVRSTITELEENVAMLKLNRDRTFEDPDSSARDKTAAGAALTAAINRLSQARGEAEITEVRIAKSPAWIKLRTAIIECTRGCSSCLEKIAVRCEAMDAEA